MSDDTQKKPTLALSLSTTTSLFDSPTPQETLLTDALFKHVDEVVVVIVNFPVVVVDHPGVSTRSTDQLSLSLSPGKTMHVVGINAESHPHLYRRDVEETFAAGDPLAGEKYPGPHTGEPFLADWASAMNLGWSRCSAEWRLGLCGGETVQDPETLVEHCRNLDENHRDVAHVSLEASPGRSSYPMRLARNLSAIGWEGAARPTIDGGIRPAILDGSPRIACADGRGLQSDRDTFRALYADAREKRWNVQPTNLLHMAKTAEAAGLPDFAPLAIDAHLQVSLYPEERAWACALMGEHLEPGDASSASRWYERSLEENPGWKSALRLCRSRFLEKKWDSCVKAYERAVELQEVLPLVDDGLENFPSSLVHVAAALHELGHLAEARLTCQILRSTYPDSKGIQALCSKIGG